MFLPILQSLLTLLLVVGAIGCALSRLIRVGTLVNAGRHEGERLTDRPADRVANVLSLVFGHKKVLEDRWSGLVHFTFLYGFMVLGIGHFEVVLEGLTSFTM